MELVMVMAQIHMPQIAESGTQLSALVGKATKVTDDGDLGENLTDAYCEVANIMSALRGRLAPCAMDCHGEDTR